MEDICDNHCYDTKHKQEFLNLRLIPRKEAVVSEVSEDR